MLQEDFSDPKWKIPGKFICLLLQWHPPWLQLAQHSSSRSSSSVPPRDSSSKERHRSLFSPSLLHCTCLNTLLQVHRIR